MIELTKYNIHIGHVYRIKLGGGMNPLLNITYDGILREVEIIENGDKFSLERAVLEDGLQFGTRTEYDKRPFDRFEYHRHPRVPLVQFASIIDEKGFYEVREEIQRSLTK